MRVLSLKLTIGGLMAAAVVVVAALCLSITLSMSMNAIRDMGTKNAQALLQTSRGSLNEYFALPLRHALFIQQFAAAHELPWPTLAGGNVTLAEIRTLVLAAAVQSGGNFDRFDFIFTDGSRVEASTVRDVGTHGAYELDVAYGDPSLQVLRPVRHYYDAATGQVLSNVTPRASPLHNIAASPGVMASLARTTGGNTTNVWAAPHMVRVEGEFVSFRGALLPVFGGNRPETLGYLYVSISLATLGRFLREAKSTPNTVAVLYDRNFATAAASFAFPIRSTERFPDGFPRTQSAPEGCQLSEPDRTIVLCFPFLRQLRNPGIAAVADDADFLLSRDTHARSVSGKGGDEFYVAQGPVSTAIDGPQGFLFVVIAIPSTDVTGDIVRGRDIAIGVTAVVAAAAVMLAWALIYAVLVPLGAVAERMERAATLQDDARVEERSAMAEIAALEDAYEDMNAELQRLKAFVPHSILWAGRLASSEEDEESEAPAGMAAAVESTDQASMVSSQRRRPASSAGGRAAGTVVTRRTRASDGKSAITAAILGEGLAVLRRDAVSVAVVNLLGFNAAAADASAAAVADAIEGAVDVVLAAVADNRGVVDSFHGDRFVATFNAVNPCAAHGRRAALFAVQALQRLPGMGFKLRGTAGVACGRAHLGNVGSAQLKRYCVVGPALSQASLLERLAKVYPDGAGCALLHPRIAADAQTHVAAHPADIVWLPGASKPAVVSLATHELDAGARNEEWLYVLAAGGDAVVTGAVAVFDELANGRAEGAAAQLKELLSNATEAERAARSALIARMAALVRAAREADPGVVAATNHGALHSAMAGRACATTTLKAATVDDEFATAVTIPGQVHSQV